MSETLYPILTPTGTYEGPLEKWTNYVTVWQYRWFVLDPDDGTLFYYTAKNKVGAVRGSMHLRHAVIILDESDDQFQITSPGQRPFHLRAKDTEERTRWCDAFKRVQIDAQSRVTMNQKAHLLQSTQATAPAPTATTATTGAGAKGNSSSLPAASAPPARAAAPTAAGSASPSSSSPSPFPANPSAKALTSAKSKITEARTYSNVLQQQIDSLLDAINGQPSPASVPEPSSATSGGEDIKESALIIKATTHALIRALDQAAASLDVALSPSPTSFMTPSTGVSAERASSNPAVVFSDASGKLTPTYDSAASGSSDTRLSQRSLSVNSAEDNDNMEFYDAAEMQGDADDGADTGNADLNQDTSAGSDTEEAANELEPDEDSDDDEEDDSHKSVLIHLLSQLRIGMDLTKVVLPTFILEKRSLLEMYADFMAHPDVFVRVSEQTSPRERMVELLRWYLSAFHVGRKSSVAKKPYNPIIGETFYCQYGTPSGALTFVAEQVSHHPPVSAFYAECPSANIRMDAHIWTKSKFLGLSVAVINVGEAHITMTPKASAESETYVATFPAGYARSILSVPWVELVGQTSIACARTGYTASISFNAKPTFGGKPHQITAELHHSSSSKPLLKLWGEWNGVVFVKDMQTDQQSIFVDTKAMQVFKKQVAPAANQGPFESRRLWKHVTEALKARHVDEATVAKTKLEERQRREERERKEKGVEWKPKLFTKDAAGMWTYSGNGATS